jgi:hypothetical protein
MLGRDVQDIQHGAEDGQGERSSTEDGCAPIESPCVLAIEEAAPDEKCDGEEDVCSCVADMCAHVGDIFDSVVWVEL